MAEKVGGAIIVTLLVVLCRRRSNIGKLLHASARSEMLSGKHVLPCMYTNRL